MLSSFVPELVVPLKAVPQRRSGNQSEDVASQVDGMSLNISRGPLLTVNLTRDRSSDAADGEDDTVGGGTFVGTGDVGGKPSPENGNGDEPTVDANSQNRYKCDRYRRKA